MVAAPAPSHAAPITSNDGGRKMHKGLIALLAAGATLTGSAAATANTRVVEEKNNQLTRDFVDDEECGGFTVAEHYDVRRTIVATYDDAGELLREDLNIKFDGSATNQSTGRSLPVDGTRHIVFDYVAGTFTETGVLRHVTVRGQGIVLHDSGKEVEDLDDESIRYFAAGPKQLRDGDLDAFCAALAQA
jgi:hypothetical protein